MNNPENTEGQSTTDNPENTEGQSTMDNPENTEGQSTMDNPENTEGNQQWTIQRNWQHTVHKTMKKQNKNATRYVLDTTMRKQNM
jgi:hypothetical protein